ncbi:MAG: 5'-nucleotidase [Psychrobacter sp.]|nr:5'-nucleotidase [Psychrobacter sp.]
MAYDLSQRLVVGLSSSALFDLTESDQIFKEQGEKAYRQYQREHQDDVLKTGDAYPFIRRLLKLNELSSTPEDPLVEVILLSKNDPDTGLRVMNSIEHYGLPITRAVFLQGQSPHQYIPAFDIELFLSANKQDIDQAVANGLPAGQILKGDMTDDDADEQLRIAFDFDGVIIDDEAEAVYKSGKLAAFYSHETHKVNIPHHAGPLKSFLARIAFIQQVEEAKIAEDASYQRILRVSIVTARSAPAHKRMINTLRDWDISTNEAFFMGGIDKAKVLEILKPHIFFDDQVLHLTSPKIPSVHIPFGVANQVDNGKGS